MANTALISHDFDTIWKPIPGTSQELALDSRCNETLYCGTRGPGKTDTQLMRFRRRVGLGYGDFWRGIILDVEYKNLDDVIKKSKRWFNKFDDGARFLESTAALKWVWSTGEELLFRVAKTPDDYWNYHGQEFPFIGWNELTKYPNSELYDMMLSTNRTSFIPNEHPSFIDGAYYSRTGHIRFLDKSNPNAVKWILPPIPLEVFSTTNPYGVGHNWVKRRFIDVAPYGKVVRRYISIVNPKTKAQEIVTRSQVAIFGSYVENPYLAPEYIASLNEEKNKNRKKAWLTGDWNIVAGGAFDDVWSKSNIVPRFKIPKTWRIDRAMDWGSTHPFAVLWFAEANGEEAQIEYNGELFTFCPYPGSIIVIHELYGAEEIGTNKGLMLSASEVAKQVMQEEIRLMESGVIKTQPKPGPADNQIRDVRESDVESIEMKMAKEGVKWTKSDKSPGSRKNGLQLVRDRLTATCKNEEPGLYFFDTCTACISTIPMLPRDSKILDDVDTKGEDHLYDALRYRVLNKPIKFAESIPTSLPS